MMERPRGPPDLKMIIVDIGDDNDANYDEDWKQIKKMITMVMAMEMVMEMVMVMVMVMMMTMVTAMVGHLPRIPPPLARIWNAQAGRKGKENQLRTLGIGDGRRLTSRR